MELQPRYNDKLLMPIPGGFICPSEIIVDQITMYPNYVNAGCYCGDLDGAKAHYHSYSGSGIFAYNMFEVSDMLIEKDRDFYIPFLLTADCVEIRKYVKEKYGTIPV